MYAAISIDAEVPVSFAEPGDINDILAVSEAHAIPLTWLIYSSAARPDEVARYYRSRVMPRIPGYHEIGLHVHFDDHRLQNYQTDPEKRRAAVIAGAKVLESCGVRPTSFRAGCWCLQPSDIEALEEVGVLADSSPCTGFRSTNHPGHGDWRELSLRDPYCPSYSSLLEKGDARLIVIPVCSSVTRNARGWCDCGYLDYRTWPELKRILCWYADRKKLISMGMHDGHKNKAHTPAEVMNEAAPYLLERGYKFVTLTQLRNFWLQGEDDE